MFEKELHGTWDIWKNIDFSFIEWCDELYLINFEQSAVNNSTGVQEELKYTRDLTKNIFEIYLREGEELKDIWNERSKIPLPMGKLFYFEPKVKELKTI